MTPLVLAVLILASFRVTRFIVEDSIFDRPRKRWQFWFPVRGDSHRDRPKRGTTKAENNSGTLFWSVTRGTFLGEVTACDWCAGVWVSAALTAAIVFGPAWLLWPVGALAVAGGQGIVSQWSSK